MVTEARSIDAVITDFIRIFQGLGDWEERYRYIIRLGKNLAPFPEVYKTDMNRIHGCQSRVWLASRYEHGVMHYCAFSDAQIVNGLIALLLEVYNRRSPAEIVGTAPDFLSLLGLSRHLSPMRSNGLYHMLQRIQSDGREALLQSAGTDTGRILPGVSKTDDS